MSLEVNYLFECFVLYQLISVQDALCVRGYWNIPEDASKVDILELFKRQIQQIGFSDLKDALYFPLGTGKVHLV